MLRCFLLLGIALYKLLAHGLRLPTANMNSYSASVVRFFLAIVRAQHQTPDDLTKEVREAWEEVPCLQHVEALV